MIFDYPNPTVTKTIRAPLTNGVVVGQGSLLCGDPATGKLVAAASADDTMIPLGFAARDYVGDGTTAVEVELFRPVWLYTFLNDATAPVATLFAPASVKDYQTVQAGGSGPVLGVALGRSTTQVLVAVGPALSLTS